MTDSSQDSLLIHTLGDVYLAGHHIDPWADIPSQIQAMFIYLAMQDAPVSHAFLATLFWSTLNQRLVQENLQQLLHDSNHYLGAYLQFGRNAVGLNPSFRYQVDADIFQQRATYLLCRMNPADVRSAQQIQNLQSVLHLYRGIFLATLTPLPNTRYEAWAQQIRSRLHNLARQAFNALWTYWLEQQDLPKAIAQLRTWLRAVPYDDAVHAELMVLLGQAGQYAEAIEHYELYRARLAQLGKEPAIHLHNLYIQFRTHRQ